MSDPLTPRSVTTENFRRIREVFESAVERPAEERQAFVENSCGGDTLLIAEVQRMLAAEDQRDRLLDAAQQVPAARERTCVSCKAPFTISDNFCRSCGTPVESESRAEGRFRTGALFANRFRIVGLLGRGGMGEVYRAHDLALDQAVALKFLSAVGFDDRARLRLRNEVRLARQVSHSNVCRVYDIGEAQGELYLSMEYVDGEDLASLLRRIGRLPVDKGIEIALKLCAGLSAAHAKGMRHRDLKPANIMIDSSGEVRIMDFGLAAFGDDLRATQVQEGTPYYMAPEQLAGEKVSVQSDIYALGLVLYEMLTGKLPFVATTPAELRRLREESRITPPSTLIGNLDPMVEGAILRCLEPDPKMRPASAMAVAALLPGGDPLATALAAGETPSPEMVAAAGSTEPLRPAVAMLLLAGVAAGLIAIWLTAPRVQMLSWLSLTDHPEVLSARTQEIVRSLGYTDPPNDSKSGFRFESGYLDYMKMKKVLGQEQWRRVLSRPPAPVSFWYRQSPAPLLPIETGGFWEPVLQQVRLDDPFTTPGMVSVVMGLEGRLLRFAAQPLPELASSARDEETQLLDWSPLFVAAGLDPNRFIPTAPKKILTVPTDARAAWIGTDAEHPDLQLRVEAGSYRGRVAYFENVPPWTGTAPPPFPWWENPLDVILLLFAALLARRNWKTGRADFAGAWRVGLFVLAVSVLVWALASDHATPKGAVEGLWQTALPFAVFWGVLVSLYYLAIEPWVRRELAGRQISWSRVLAGRWRDPLVGRDILLGLLWSIGSALLGRLGEFYVLGIGGPPTAVPWVPNESRYLVNLMGPFSAMTGIVHSVWSGFVNGFFFFAFLVVFSLLLRKKWFAVAAMVAYLTLSPALLSEGTPEFISYLLAFLWAVLIVIGMFRFGLLAMVIQSFAFVFLRQTFITPDFSTWYGASSLVALIAISALALVGFRLSVLGRPLWAAQSKSGAQISRA